MSRPRKIVYHERGLIERPDGRGSYRWTTGYSEDGECGPCQPWITRAEACAEAQARGGRATFRRKP